MQPYESQLVILATNYPVDVLQLQTSLSPEMRDTSWQFYDHLKQGGVQQRDLFPSIVLHPAWARLYFNVGQPTTLVPGKTLDEIREAEKELVGDLQSEEPESVLALLAILNNRHDDGKRITRNLTADTLIPNLLDFGNGAYQRTLDRFVEQFGCRRRSHLDKTKY